MSIRKRVAVAAIGLSAVYGGTIGLGIADAATSGSCYSNSRQTCRPTMSTSWAPWSSPNSRGPADNWTIARGTSVDMRCWTTGANRLGTAKWFYVTSQGYPYTSGYVPANAVANQITVGRC